jgi:NADH-quinone oxidoreductase subunit J
MKLDWFMTIYCLFALGALGLYLMLPRSRRLEWPKIGAVLAGAALVVLVGMLWYSCRSAFTSEHFWFTLFSGAAIVSAILMLCQKRILYGALYFVLTNLSVAGLLLLQQAQFLGIALVIVYAGAIVVIYVFVLMLSQQERPPEYDKNARMPFLAVLVGFFLLGAIMQVVIIGAGESDTKNNAIQTRENLTARQNSPDEATITRSKLAQTGTARALGKELFENHVVAFEVAGVILLIAAVGAIAILRAPQIKEQKQKE